MIGFLLTFDIIFYLSDREDLPFSKVPNEKIFSFWKWLRNGFVVLSGRWVVLKGNENMGSVQEFILLLLCLAWIKRIRRQREFKISLCNTSRGSPFRESQFRNLPNMNDGAPLRKQRTVDCFFRKAPPQTPNRIPSADPTRGSVNLGDGWTASAWNL